MLRVFISISMMSILMVGCGMKGALQLPADHASSHAPSSKADSAQ